MDSNITEQELRGAELQLSEPHFDEEATLLSARPVVPLAEIKAESNSGRKSFSLGLALVAAVMVGALGATVILKQRSPNERISGSKTATSVSPELEGQAPTLAAAGGSGFDTTVPQPTTDENAANLSKPDSSRAKASGDAGRNETVRLREKKEMRQPTRVETTDAKVKAEREARREKRNQRGQSDDLLRIREIFEGSPRP